MAVLALDSSGNACSAAIWAEGGLRAERFEPRTRGQAERLVPMVQEVLAESGLAFGAIRRIAVVRGPGSFTGLRVALATARALGLALNRPVEGYDAFAVALGGLSQPHERTDRLLLAIDSRRREPFVRLFEGGRPAGPPYAASPEDLAAQFAGQTLRLGGNAAQALAAALRPRVDAQVAEGDGELRAATLAVLAGSCSVEPAAPEPLYLRPPDVTHPRHGRPAG